MQAEFKTAQLRVKPRCIIAEGSGGTIFYATPTRARLLIDGGAAELVNVGPVELPAAGPRETPTAGPSEFKEPAEKKYSAADQDGRSTDSAPLIESGKAQPLSSSAADPASPKRKYTKRGTRAAK